MTRRQWRQHIWRCLRDTFYNDLNGIAAAYLYIDDAGDPLSEIEERRMRAAADEVMKRLNAKAAIGQQLRKGASQ